MKIKKQECVSNVDRVRKMRGADCVRGFAYALGGEDLCVVAAPGVAAPAPAPAPAPAVEPLGLPLLDRVGGADALFVAVADAGGGGGAAAVL